MPVQKGKKRRKPRHRTAAGERPVETSPVAVPVQNKSSPPRLRGLNLPWWANSVVGIFIIAVGVVFYLHPARGTTSSWQLIFLLGYFVIGALYLGKAVRQIIQRRRL